MKQQSKLESAAEKALNSYYHLSAQMVFYFARKTEFPDSINRAMDELEKNLLQVEQLAKEGKLKTFWKRLVWSKKPL